MFRDNDADNAPDGNDDRAIGGRYNFIDGWSARNASRARVFIFRVLLVLNYVFMR